MLQFDKVGGYTLDPPGTGTGSGTVLGCHQLYDVFHIVLTKADQFVRLNLREKSIYGCYRTAAMSYSKRIF